MGFAGSRSQKRDGDLIFVHFRIDVIAVNELDALSRVGCGGRSKVVVYRGVMLDVAALDGRSDVHGCFAEVRH